MTPGLLVLWVYVCRLFSYLFVNEISSIEVVHIVLSNHLVSLILPFELLEIQIFQQTLQK